MDLISCSCSLQGGDRRGVEEGGGEEGLNDLSYFSFNPEGCYVCAVVLLGHPGV